VPKDESVEISVSDTGVGIAPEDQEAVFEEFRQVGTAERKAEGTGLGLHIHYRCPGILGRLSAWADGSLNQPGQLPFVLCASEGGVHR